MPKSLPFNQRILGPVCLIILLIYAFMYEGELKLEAGQYDDFVHTFHLGKPVSSDVTVVTMYFQLNKSKHSIEKYDAWQANFFNSVTMTPIVIFTDRNSLPDLLKKSRTSSNPKTFHVLNSVWDLTRMIGQYRGRSYVQPYRTSQHDLDPEKKYHSPHLYAIWSAKSFIMKRASEALWNFYQSKFFVFTDIGAFRERVYSQWPDQDHLMKTKKALGKRILFGQVSNSTSRDNFTIDFTQGGFFAGTPRSLRTYYLKFYEIHDELLDADKFVGKEQTIMNIFTRAKYPSLSCHLYLQDLITNCLPDYNIWFIYQFYFSHRNRRSWYELKSDANSLIISMMTFSKKSNVLSNEHVCLKSKNRYFTGRASIRCDNGRDEIAGPICNTCERKKV